jgi:uncharacterized membrane protein (UPF0127 family)
MKILNVSKNTVLADEVFIADTFMKKVNGLTTFGQTVSLFMKTRWGIHTFDMKFPIDCVVCDNDMKVVAVRESLAPNSFFFWKPSYKNVIELPMKTISRSGTAIGDTLKKI